MLLKFSSPDMLDTTLVEPSTGSVAYTILTRPHFIQAKSDADSDCTVFSDSDSDSESEALERRRTVLLDSTGTRVLAEIGWVGLQPADIVIGDERLDGAKELFGCSSSLMS